MDSTRTLSTVPIEEITLIASFMELVDIFRLMSTCKRLRESRKYVIGNIFKHNINYWYAKAKLVIRYDYTFDEYRVAKDLSTLSGCDIKYVRDELYKAHAIKYYPNGYNTIIICNDGFAIVEMNKYDNCKHIWSCGYIGCKNYCYADYDLYTSKCNCSKCTKYTE